VIFDADDKPIDYRFLEINPAFEGQTGLIDAEGKLMRDLAPDHEEYWFEIYGKIALTGKPMRFVNEAKALNRWYDVYAFKIGDPEGREVAILFNDITKRKKIEDDLEESEERYSLTVESVNEGVWEWNVPTGEAYFSPTYYKILGYDDGEFPASYESFRSLIHPDDVESFEKELQIHIDNAEGYSLEIRLKTKDGKWRWILTNGKVVETGEDGKPLRMLGTHTDITERKQADEQLKRTMDELKRSNMELEQFAYVASHDLQEPLRMVSSFTQLLEKQYKDKLDENALDYI
jgi:PAS domain S-box-containing protein